jgi:hypothetical protein
VAKEKRNRPDAPPRFLTPGGGTITIDAPGYDLGELWSCTFEVRVERPYAGTAAGLQMRHLQVAPVGNADFLISRLLRGRVVQEVAAQGGRILIARSDVDDRALVVWRGQWHEVFDWVNEPGASGAQLLRRLERLTFVDSPLGVRVLTGKVPVETVEAEQVRKRIPGVGFLHILDGASGAMLVPTWSGARVPTGEVWRKDLLGSDGTPKSLLVHVSPTTVTTLAGDIDDELSEGPRLQFLSVLRQITWTKA